MHVKSSDTVLLKPCSLIYYSITSLLCAPVCIYNNKIGLQFLIINLSVIVRNSQLKPKVLNPLKRIYTKKSLT